MALTHRIALALRIDRLRLPAAVLMTLLQRTPALRVAATAAESLLESPAGAVLRAAAASLAALGAVDTVAGATQFFLSTGIPGHPSPYTVTQGSQIAAVAFALSNTVLSQAQAGSWTLEGSFPPGLHFGSQAQSISANGDLIGQSNPELFGTPTAVGTYMMSIEAWQGEPVTSASSGFFTYEVVVTAAATPPAAGSPVFTTQPVSVAVDGGTVALDAVATNSPAYQWYLNVSEPIPGATGPTLLLTTLAGSQDTYTCVATNAAGSATSDPATVTYTGPVDDFGHLTNLSTRALVGTGSNILIAGFAVGGGGGADPLLIRASGPALGELGLTMGTLPDPQLTLVSGSATVAANSGWGGSAAISAEAASVGAFPWLTPASLDAAVATSLGTGTYSAQVAGASRDTGIALAEVYDGTPEAAFTGASPRLVNLSARVLVGTGGNILIAGFAIGGDTSRTVLIRASGPALGALGVAGTLPDPQLTLVSGSANLAQNTGWGGNPQVAAEAARVGAFSWGSAATPDSALLVTLPPGTYSAEVAGSSGDTGIALVEVYEVP